MKLRLITGVCFAVFFSDTSLVFGQKTLVDSLTHQLTLVTREDSDRVKILNELSDRTYRNDPDLASVYAKESIQIAHKISYLKGEAEGNHLLGLPHFYRENTDSAAYYFKKALELYEKIGDKRGTAGIEASLGATYALLGNFKKATEFSIRALVIYEELENYPAIAIMYNNIGNLYSDQEVFDNAIENYKRSLLAFAKTEDKRQMACTLDNIAVSLKNLGKLDESIQYIEQGIENAELYQNKGMLGSLMLTAGGVHLMKEEYESAKLNFEKANEINLELGNTRPLIEGTYYLAEVESHLGNVKESRDYLIYVLERINSDNVIFPRLESDALTLLAQHEQKLGNYSKGIEYVIKAKTISDSLYHQENARAIAELQTTYELEKKEQTIELLEAENLASHSQIVLAMVVGLVLLITVSFIFWIVNRDRATKRRLELESVKRELENYGVLIAEKDSFMTSLIEKLRDMSRSLKTLESRKEVNLLIDSLHQNVELTWDEEHLIQRIEQVNRGFFNELEHRLGKLSKNEKRIASLVQMELSNKEIGGILNINARSVAQARYRLKKRMKLSNEEDLVEFLKSLASLDK